MTPGVLNAVSKDAGVDSRSDNRYWNQFRGPDGDGASAAKNLPVGFSETTNVRWKIPIHGEGWSSPVVWGKQIWLTTGRLEGWTADKKKGSNRAAKLSDNERRKLISAVTRSIPDEERDGWKVRAEGISDEDLIAAEQIVSRGKRKGGGKKGAASGVKKKAIREPKKTGGSLELFAVCVNLNSGKIIHDIKVFDVLEPQVANPGLNTHATPTPVVEDGRIYVHFGAYGTACLDTKTGEKLWERRDLHTNHEVRAGSSPIVDDDSVYLHFDGTDKQFVAALDKRTGKTRWLKRREADYDLDGKLSALGFSKAEIESTKKKKPGDNRKSYATPSLISYKGKRQLISPAAEATFSYNPDTGAELWRVRHPGMGWNVAARPVFADGTVYSFTGISRHMMAVRPSGTGDVTDTHNEWIIKGKDVPAIPSALIVDGLIFLITDEGFASCWDIETGKRLWRKRLRAGGTHWASPVYADDKLYFVGQKGTVTVLAASREFQLLAENQFDASFNATPAVVDGGLILRSFTDLYYVALPRKGK